MNKLLKNNERLEDLNIDNKMIIQNPNGYCFTSDAVMLSNFVKVKKTDKVCDFCSGSGIIGLLIYLKQSPKQVTCIEIQPSLADMARRSILYNNLQEYIQIINDDCKRAVSILGAQSQDVVVCNPPYQKYTEKNDNPSEVDICKTEVSITLEDIIIQASKILKNKGSFYLIQKSNRLSEIIYLLKKNSLEPKQIVLVKPGTDKDIDIVMIKAVKGAKEDTKISVKIRDKNGW